MLAERTPLHEKLKRKRVENLIRSFLRQARDHFYDRYQGEYLYEEYMSNLLRIDNNSSQIRQELAQCNWQQLEELEVTHLEKMQKMGMTVDTQNTLPDIEELIREIKDDALRGTLLYANRYGDDNTRKVIEDYFDERSEIRFDLDPNEAMGKATKEDDKIIYHISKDYEHAEKKHDLLNSAHIFVHESYRDGLNKGVKQDTRNAVYADIEFAKKIAEDFGPEFVEKSPYVK